ncbi:MAG: fibronectin type III domain-containing protein [Lachnospiraceae bacterium]
MRKNEGKSLIALVLCVCMMFQMTDFSRIVGYAAGAQTPATFNVKLTIQGYVDEKGNMIDIAVDKQIEYQGETIQPDVTIIMLENGNELQLDSAHGWNPNTDGNTIIFKKNDTNEQNEYKVTYGGTYNGKNYDNKTAKNDGLVRVEKCDAKTHNPIETEVAVEFDIKKRDVTKDVEYNGTKDFEYTGKAIKLQGGTLEYTNIYGHKKQVPENDPDDTTWSTGVYQNNIEPNKKIDGSDISGANQPTVDINVIAAENSNYTSGIVKVQFDIKKGNLKNYKAETISGSKEYTFSGNIVNNTGNVQVQPKIKRIVSQDNSIELDPDTDYEISRYDYADTVRSATDTTNPPQIIIKGKNNFDDNNDLIVPFTIKICDLSKLQVASNKEAVSLNTPALVAKWKDNSDWEKMYSSADKMKENLLISFITEDGEEIPWEEGKQYKVTKWTPPLSTEKQGTLEITANMSGITSSREIKMDVPKKDLKILKEKGKVSVGWADENTTNGINYTGTAITPTVVVKEGDKKLELGKDYDLTYENNIKPNKENRIPCVKIVGKGDYTGTIPQTFTIKPLQLTESNVKLAVTGNHSYAGGNSIEPKQNELNVQYQSATGYTKLDDTQYKIDSYGANKNVGDAIITISGVKEEGYEGVVTCSFEILPCAIDTNATVMIQPQKYAEKDGKPQAVVPSAKDISVTIGDKIGGSAGTEQPQTLIYGTDYTVTCTNNDKVTNEAQCTVKAANGNYTGEKTVNFSIKKDISDFDITVANDQYYNGKEITPKVTITDPFTNAPVPEEAYTLTATKTGETTASSVKEAGTYSLKLEAKADSDYMGTKTVNYKLNPCVINNTDFTLDAIPTQYYTGAEIKPDTLVKLKTKAADGQEALELKQGVDYDIYKYTGNTEVTEDGKAGASIIIRGKGGNFGTPYGDVEFKDVFKIAKRPITKAEGEEAVANSNYTTANSFQVSNSDTYDQNFTDDVTDYKLKNAALSITCKGIGSAADETITLQEGTDYLIDYGTSETNRIGKVEATIRGIGSYTGEIPISYYIRADITNNEHVKVEQPVGMQYTYTGQPIEPFFTKVYYDYTDESLSDRVLIKDIDYEYTNVTGNNVNASNAAYTVIRGKGDCFTGEQKILFTIVPKNLAENDVKVEGFEPEVTFTGNPAKQTVKLTYNGMELKEGTDYEITYSEQEPNRIHVTGKNEDGTDKTISMIVTGKGNYIGSKTMEFRILPREITPSKENVNTITPATWSEELEYTGQPVEQSDTNLRAMTYKNEAAGMNLPMHYGNASDLLAGNEVDYTVSYKDEHTQVGDTAVILTGHGDYTGTYEIPYRIYADLGNKTYTTWEDMPDVPYAGGAYIPEVSITCAGKKLVISDDKDADAKATATGDNTNVTKEDLSNQPTLTVTGNGTYFRGTLQKSYRIVPKNLSEAIQDPNDISISPVEDTTYTGKEIKPQIQVYNHGNLMKEGEDYTLELDRSNDNINVGEKHLTLKAGTGSNYTGSIPLTYQILPRDITAEGGALTVEGVENKIYSGVAQEQTITKVTYTNQKAGMEQVELVEGKDYKVIQNENIQIGPAAVTIEGMGNYTGTKHITYEILSADFADVTINVDPVTFTGTALTPAIKVEKAGVVLQEGVDYVIAKYDNNVHAKAADEEGAPRVEIEGRGGFIGAKAGKTFTILPDDLSQDTFSVEPLSETEFNGAEQKPVPVVTKNETVLKADEDFTLEYKDNLHAGKATVVIKGCGDYTGSREIQFTITPVALTNPAVKIEPIPGQAYTGEAVIPDVTITFTNPTTQEVYTLQKGIDYITGGENNIASGEAKLHIYAISGGTFMGELETTFIIKKDLGGVQTPDILTQVYDGTPIEPEIVLFENDQTLDQGTIYTVRYENNTAAGTGVAVCEATPDSPFSGSVRIPFEILEKITGRLTVTGITENGYAYTGEPIRPSVKVSIGERVLKQDTDYTLDYTDDTQVGTAHLTISGKGKYLGTHSVSYEIIPRSIAGADVTAVADKTYTGSAIKPTIQVSMNGTELEKDVDYTIKYDHNVNPGTASIVLNGKGDYGGTKVIRFAINVPKTGGLKVADKKTSKLKLTWTKVNKASGYEIFNSSNKLVKRVTGNSVTISGLKSATTYRYKVRAYVKADGKMSHGAFSSLVTATTRPATPSVTLKSKKTKQMTISWKKLSGVTGYEIYRSTSSKSSSYKKIKTITKASTVSYTNTKLAAKKKYYYKVRAYKTVSGTKIYGSYSKAKAAKTK